MASLCLLGENGDTIERWELNDEPLAVGRDSSANIVIEDPALSRRHFLIVRESGGYLIKDLKSQNGTWVDGQRAQVSKLRHHDCILAGRTLFVFSERQPETASKVKAPVRPPGLADQSSLPAQSHGI